MRAGRVVAVIVGVVAGLIEIGLRAENLPTWSIRELTIKADFIVVGEPLDAPTDGIPTQYRVTDVLHGPENLVGTTLRIPESRLYRRRDALEQSEDTTLPPPIRKALLFLKTLPDDSPSRPPRAGYDLVHAGIRASHADGEILVPQQLRNPGPYILQPAKGVTWDDMLARVREDLPRIAEIRALKDVPDRARRNEAILRWMDEHRSELIRDPRHEGIGWGVLQQQMFEWVLESEEPEACWKVFELATDIGGWPHDSLGVFCNPEGRSLLLARAFDPTRSVRLRQLALRTLASGATLWGADRTGLPNRRSLTREEQERILDKVVPLLAHEDPHWRRIAVLCVHRLSRPEQTNEANRISHRATPALTERYRTERDPQVRRELVETLRAMEDDPFWERLTGNPEGIAVLLSPRGAPDETIELVAHLLLTKAKISEVPALRLERLTAEGAVAETRTLPLTFASSTKGRSGWESRIVALKTPRGDLPAGRWRATLEGRVGERRWSSDPIEITLPERTAAGTGR